MGKLNDFDLDIKMDKNKAPDTEMFLSWFDCSEGCGPTQTLHSDCCLDSNSGNTTCYNI